LDFQGEANLKLQGGRRGGEGRSTIVSGVSRLCCYSPLEELRPSLSSDPQTFSASEVHALSKTLINSSIMHEKLKRFKVLFL
jgi:hypothetical protein